MPRLPDFVPRVGQQNPQTPGYSAPRVAPVQDATGGQMADLGQALVQGGSAALRISDYIDDVAATTAYNTFDAELSKLESGYGQMQGKTAMDAYKGTLDSATALRRKFEESLDSERQRQLFASRAGVRFADGEIRLGAHGARQTQVAKIETLEAGSSGAFTNYEKTMAFARTLPDEDARADQEAVAMSYLQAGMKQKLEASVLRGEPPEMQEAIRVGTLDKVHDSMLDTLVSQDPQGAADYLRRFQGEMSTGTVAKRTKELEHAGVQQRSMAFAFDAMGQAAKRGGTLAEQESYASQIASLSYKGGKLDAASYAAASDRIRKEFGVQRDLQAKLSNDAVIAAEKFFLDPANKDKTLTDLDPKVTRVLEESGQLDVVQRLAARQKGYDPEMWDRVQQMTDEQHRAIGDEEFGAMALRLSPPQRELAKKLRIAAVGSPEARAKAAAGVTEAQEMRSVGRRILKDQLAEVSTDKDATNALLDDFVVDISQQWNSYVRVKNINPEDRAEFTTFLRKEEARRVTTRDGAQKSPYQLERTARLDLEANPVVLFQGKPTRVSDLPIQVTVFTPDGSTETASRDQIAARFTKLNQREPTQQELAETIAAYMRSSTQTPPRVQLPPRAIPYAPTVDIKR